MSNEQRSNPVTEDALRAAQAETRIEQAITHSAQAQTHTDQAKTRTEQHETQAEQAGIRTEQSQTKADQNNTRLAQAATQTDQDQTRTAQAAMQLEQAKTRSMEQALRASELSYRRLFEAAQDGILILDVATGRITDVNPFLVNLLGFSRAEMLGKTVGELSPFKDVVSNQAMLERLQLEGYVRYEDLPLKTKDHRDIDVEFVSNIYQAGDRKVIQCNIRDISRRKQAERTSKLLAAIVESSDDAIIGKDLNGSITSWNKGAEKIFGYTAGEMLGTSILRLIPADRQEEENQILGKIKQGESVLHFETRRQTKDGRQIDVSVTASPINDAGGRVIGVSKVARDVTERKQAENQLKVSFKEIEDLKAELEERVVKRTAELEAANKELEAFSYSVSHDLRAPLRAVNGFAAIVLEDYGPQLPEEGRRYLERIRNGGQRMGVLMDDLLAFSHLSRQSVNRRRVDSSKLVRETLEELKPQWEGRRIELRLGELPPCQADPVLLKQVWVNLLSNAIKYSRGREPAIIEIGCLPEPGATVYFVRDNGAGFDMQYANKLFGVFQRLHRADQFEGTGVGLAIVQRIVQRHGGRVWAEAQLNQGAAFYFTIEAASQPLASHDASPMTKESPMTNEEACQPR
jgi:PAS domain S-box-containing protein